LEHGLIINAPNDTSIRIAPPLIIGDTEIAEFTGKFTAALTEAELTNTALANTAPTNTSEA
ncbi:MAG: acetylornithine transaminase, partial [Salinibacterium sp.]|nr:acetylornithine transaminase [Salinibacterium sp.]